MTDLIEFLEPWLNELKAARNYSRHTIISYRHDVAEFLNFLQQHVGSTLTTKTLISARDVRSFLARLRMKEMSPTTINRKLSSIKSFFRYVEIITQQNYAELFSIQSAKKTQSLPRPLNQIDAKNAISESGQLHKIAWVNKRNIALLTLLYATGLRISEALSLTKTDINNDAKSLTVLGKGQKIRQVPLLPIARQKLSEYLSSLPQQIDNNTPIFRGIRGGDLSARGAAQIMEDVRINLGLPKTVTPHAMRHSFASHLLQNGGDIRTIQELLGHNSLSATQIYTKLDENSLLENYRNAHPRAKLKR